MRSMKTIFIFIVAALVFATCEKKESTQPVPDPPPGNQFFARGADVSWLTQMETEGQKFYNSNGAKMDCMELLKSLGVNSIRLRAWVDPSASGGLCNTEDLIDKAVRAKNLGMKIMIDLHYSDWWADPGKQNKPATWASQDFNTLKTSVYNYTVDVMNALKTNGITPEWAQVGNETNDGMLWPDGKASANMANFAQLVNEGCDGVKSVSASSKVIVHISNGFDNNLFRWIFDGIKNNNAKWDVIGMSLYPHPANWSTLNDQCLANMNDMILRYNKEIMICEVGMSWDQPDACNAFLSDLISKIKSLAGNRGLGVFYWEPECSVNWNGYTLGAFDNSGKPTIALDAFK
ncbi:MAG TPA: glycosyl hydrolase 53 family protein [Chitinophagaceae bacterium]|nr:glycosyl hydrolase 53 family protein [Chitinophagaceae bacterium]